MAEMKRSRLAASWLAHPGTGLAARLILGAIFLYASIDKIAHPDRFALAVYNYQLLPEAAVNLLALWLPWLELVSGVLLIVGIWIRGSLAVLTGLILVFLGALGFNLARGLDISCGCFSTEAVHPLTILTLLRDSLFLLLALYLFWLHQVRGAEQGFSIARLWRRRQAQSP
jgi:uncharacterized membrane protein YphA (DoxX/SURF4 family)